jgi:hypothetical protein
MVSGTLMEDLINLTKSGLGPTRFLYPVAGTVNYNSKLVYYSLKTWISRNISIFKDYKTFYVRKIILDTTGPCNTIFLLFTHSFILFHSDGYFTENDEFIHSFIHSFIDIP